MLSNLVYRKLHCRIWHTIPDTPLLLSVRKRWVALVCALMQGCDEILQCLCIILMPKPIQYKICICCMYHNVYRIAFTKLISVVPLPLTCHCFSPLGQRDSQETERSMSSLCKEAGLAEVTMKDHGFEPSEESVETLSVDPIDLSTAYCNTVDQAFVRYSECR